MNNSQFQVYLLLAILYTVAACSHKTDYSESKILYDEAIVIHDEVMPLMGNIVELQRKLKEVKNGVSDEYELEKINQSLQHLENAHQGMMNWMRTLTPIPDPDNPLFKDQDTKTIPEGEMLTIQKKSLENIKNVRSIMLESIDEAKDLLSNY